MAGPGLCALPHRRRHPRGGRAAGAQPQRPARHRRRGRPAARVGDGAHAAPAPGRELRGGAAAGRGARAGGGDAGGRGRRRRPGRDAGAPVQQPLRLPALQLFAARARAEAVLLQLAGGRLPGLRRPGPGHGLRSRARRRLPEPEPGLGGGQGLGPAQSVHAFDAAVGGAAPGRGHRAALRGAARARAPGLPVGLGRGGHRVHLRGRGRARQGPQRQAFAPLRGHHPELRAPHARDRLAGGARGARALPGGPPLHGLRRHPAAARGAARAVAAGLRPPSPSLARTAPRPRRARARCTKSRAPRWPTAWPTSRRCSCRAPRRRSPTRSCARSAPGCAS